MYYWIAKSNELVHDMKLSSKLSFGHRLVRAMVLRFSLSRGKKVSSSGEELLFR
jgi:hypothetical protein